MKKRLLCLASAVLISGCDKLDTRMTFDDYAMDRIDNAERMDKIFPSDKPTLVTIDFKTGKTGDTDYNSWRQCIVAGLEKFRDNVDLYATCQVPATAIKFGGSDARYVRPAPGR